MTRTAVIHIGMHKTGSSAIQRSLRGFDNGRVFYAPFRDENHSVPILTAFRPVSRPHHFWRNQGASDEEISSAGKAFREDLDSMLKRTDRDTIIFSGEDIGFLSDPLKLEFLKCLENRGWAPKVICYVRDPVGYAASAFQEEVKHRSGALPETIHPAYRTRLAFFAEYLGPDDLVVRPFDRAELFERNVVKDFCKVVGIDDAEITPARVNESMSFDATRLLFNFNRVGLVTSGDPRTNRAFRELRHLIARLYAARDKAPEALFKEFADHSELDWLETEFGITFAPRAGAAVGNVVEWLNDLSGIDHTNLDQMLVELGLRPEHYSTPVEKLQRLYFYYLYVDDLKNHERELAERLRAGAAWEEAAAERDALFLQLEEATREKSEVLAQLNAGASQLRAVIRERDAVLRRLEEVTRERDSVVADSRARKSRLAYLIDYLDYRVHVALGKTRVFGEGFQRRFRTAAERRYRDCYDKN